MFNGARSVSKAVGKVVIEQLIKAAKKPENREKALKMASSLAVTYGPAIGREARRFFENRPVQDYGASADLVRDLNACTPDTLPRWSRKALHTFLRCFVDDRQGDAGLICEPQEIIDRILEQLRVEGDQRDTLESALQKALNELVDSVRDAGPSARSATAPHKPDFGEGTLGC